MKLGHLWQQDPSGRLHVFHNSFRLFLLRITSTNTLGKHDESRQLQYHRELAERYQLSELPPNRWEAVYHLWKTGDRQGALNFVTLESVREQTCHFRFPNSLFSDLRILLELAFEDRNLQKVAEIAIAWNELNLVEYSLSEQYDEISRQMLAAGDVDTALRMLIDGKDVNLKLSTCMDAAVKMSKTGLAHESRLLFFAAEPLSQLHQIPEIFDQQSDALRVWAKHAGRFRRPAQVLQMIRTAPLRSTREGINDTNGSESIRDELLIQFGEGLIDGTSNDVLDEIDQDLKIRSRQSWLKLRVRRLSALPSSAHDDRRELGLAVVDEYTQVKSTSLKAWERLLVAEIAFFCCNESELAKQMLENFPPPPSMNIEHGDQISTAQRDWFRLFWLRGFLDEQPDVATEINLDSENELRKAAGFFARHLARLGLMTVQRYRNEFPTSTLIRELQGILRFMSQREGSRLSDDPYREVRRRRPAVMRLVFDYFCDAESLDELAEFFIKVSDGRLGGDAWTIVERLKVFHTLIDAGIEHSRGRDLLATIEAHWSPGEPFSSYRAEREIYLAKARVAIGDNERALTHLQEAMATQGTVDHRKDYQLEIWCNLLAEANRRNANTERVLSRIGMMVKATRAASSTDAPSEDAALVTTIEAARHNPMEGLSLVEILSHSGATSFVAAAATFITNIVKEDKNCAPIALSICKHILMPLSSPIEGIVDTISMGMSSSKALDELAMFAERIALPEDRRAWKIAIHNSAERQNLDTPESCRDLEVLNAGKKSSSAEGTNVKVGVDEWLSLEDACKMVHSPDDFRTFRSKVGNTEWLRTDALTTELCRQWDSAQLESLAQVISEYDDEGSELMICAERLQELGQRAGATRLAKVVLETGGRGYEEDWRRNGPLLRAVKLLQREISMQELRELVCSALHGRLKAGRAVSFGIGFELFGQVLPRICDDEEFMTIAEPVEQFLTHATRFMPSDSGWHRPFGSNREALLQFIAERLAHPVNFLSEAAQKTLYDLIVDNELNEDDVQFLCGCVENDKLSIRGLLAALLSTVRDSPDAVRRFADWLRHIGTQRDFGLRVEVEMILTDLDEPRPLPLAIDTQLLQEYMSKPLVSPPRIGEEDLKNHNSLPDTFDAKELAAHLKPEVEILARASKVDFSNILRRVYDISVSFGRERLTQKFENELRGRFTNASLQLTYQRPRSTMLSRAIHQVATELVDAGKINVDDIRHLTPLIRTTDPDLLRIVPQLPPKNLVTFDPPDGYGDAATLWVVECQHCSEQIRKLVLREKSDLVVLAEASFFRSGRRFRKETRVSNLWVGDKTPENLENILPKTYMSYAAQYESASADEAAIGIQHFPTMEFHGSHCHWMVMNAYVAKALGLSPDFSRLLGWKVDDDSVWVERWFNGHPLVSPRDGQQSDGWLLLATVGIAQRLLETYSEIKRFCFVRRQLDEEDGTISEATWNEPFNIPMDGA